MHYLKSTQRSTFKFCTHDLHNMPMVQVIYRCILVDLQKGLTTFKGSFTYLHVLQIAMKFSSRWLVTGEDQGFSFGGGGGGGTKDNLCVQCT